MHQLPTVNRSEVATPEQQKQSMEVRPLCELDAKENDSMLSPCSPTTNLAGMAMEIRTTGDR